MADRQALGGRADVPDPVRHAGDKGGRGGSAPALRRGPVPLERAWYGVPLALAIVLLVPPLFQRLGAPPLAARSLGLLVFGLVGWGAGAFHQTVVSLLILVFIPLLGLGDFALAVSGFGEPFIWLVVSVFVLGKGMEASGLDRRIALGLLRLARGRTVTTLYAVLGSVLVLGFLVPTGAGRTAMLTPICTGMMQVIEERLPAGSRDVRNWGRALFIGFTYVTLMMSWALVTGSVTSVYAVAAVRELTGFQWTYAYWMLISVPIVAAFALLLPPLLLRLFPVGLAEVPGGLDYIVAQQRRLGPVRGAETRVMALLGLVVAGWVTEPYHGWPIPLVALMGALLMCLPPLGVQTWQEAARAIKWDVVILFGAGFGLARALQASGAAQWVAAAWAAQFPSPSPWLAGLLVLVVILAVRLAFANMLASAATFLPITISLAASWHINPVWLAQLAVIASGMGFFLPYQAPAMVIAYTAGHFAPRDLWPAGLGAAALIIALTLGAALAWWPLAGLAP
ncbi:MAG: DASS family sodium-coupled anion symporter [Limnochordales bacterium]|nr:DASS family sodium-coupled anion symporter [Limnochordales bacterium]